MARITITHETQFISEETGYSAWVHVTNESDEDFAHHVGYYDNEHAAKDKAKNAAKGMARAVRLTGRKPVVVEGEHK